MIMFCFLRLYCNIIIIDNNYNNYNTRAGSLADDIIELLLLLDLLPQLEGEK